MAYVIKDNCMHCQRCVVQCPVQAIRYNGVIMEIDSEKCISCGRCAELCLIDAAYDPDKPVEKAVPHEQLELECGLVVLGAGGTGLVAAAKASELTDEKIIVLEKNTRPGGGAWYSGTAKIYGSRWQEEHGIRDYTQEHFEKYMDYTYSLLDPHVVYNCFKYTGEFFDWFYDGLPKEKQERFTIGTYHVDGAQAHPVPVYRPANRLKDDGMGRMVMERCMEICREHGTEILTEHRAIDLEMTDGKISAVIAEDPGGRTRIRCKACIIATGSWINDREILKKAAPLFAKATPHRSCHLNPNYTGDGIPLAEKAGAFIDYDSFCLRNMGPFYYDIGQCCESQALASISTDTRMIYVNKNGKRWMDECAFTRINPFETCVGLEHQPGCVSYTLFDTSILERTATESLSGERICNNIFGPCHYPENWREEIDKIAEDGIHLLKADSISELAELCGIDPEALVAEVARYNSLCEKGVDEDYHKPASELLPLVQAPYYAVVCHIQTDGGFGGILVNEHSQAYAKDKKNLIEGLWCGGDFASGRFINQGGVKRQIINDVAWAYSSGYNAGIHAAEYLNCLA